MRYIILMLLFTSCATTGDHQHAEHSIEPKVSKPVIIKHGLIHIHKPIILESKIIKPIIKKWQN